MNQLDLSVVVPIYNEEEGILNFAEELRKNLDLLNLDYEVLFINDGSSDKTQEKIDSINWTQLLSFEFQFNAGHMRALEAGFEKAKGEMIISLDSDLQHPPSYIKDLIRIKKEQNVDVVYGVRDSRSEDKFVKRLSAKFYYFIMKKLSGINIRENAADFRLITKKVNEVLKSIPDENKIYRLLIPSLKFAEAELVYKADKRVLGKTKYSFKKMSLLALSSVLSFSTRPLRWAIWLGLFSVIISLVWITYVIIAQISGWVIQGWTSLIAAVILFSGVQLLLLGIFGQYIGQIYITQQKHPKYLFKQK
jgi:dolichol-phosphate mannosyltransferase